MRRYERPHINEVWCGDSSVGPRLTMPDGKKHRIYIIALMRYGAIAPIIAGLDERYPSKTAFFAEISAKGLMGPDGTAADTKQGYAPLRTPPYQRSLVWG